jgi:hypothetical protein
MIVREGAFLPFYPSLSQFGFHALAAAGLLDKDYTE